MAAFLVLSLVLLVFLNMILFYKLWTLEQTTQSLASLQGLRARDRYGSFLLHARKETEDF